MNNYSFEANYYDDHGNIIEVVSVKRVVRSKLKDLIALQQQALNVFFDADGAVGQVLSEEKNWNLLAKIAALLPIVGSNEYLDLNKFAEDYGQITRIFFSEDVDEDGVYHVYPDKPISPSLISKLHQLNYGDAVGKAMQYYRERRKTEQS